MNIKPDLDRVIIGYCRFLSNKQKDDLGFRKTNRKYEIIPRCPRKTL